MSVFANLPNLLEIKDLLSKDPETLGFFLLSVAVLVLAIHSTLLWFKIRRLTLRGQAETLDQALQKILASIDKHSEFEKEMEKYLTKVETRLRRSVQSISTTRFNAFKGSGEGSNQSFATAFLNELGNGLVVSTLYSRDRVSIFGKPVNRFVSEYSLSEEENGALQEARKNLEK